MARILVVDDLRVDRLLVEELLRAEANIEVDCAADGAEALERVEAQAPDLILTDLYMPRMDGLELVAAMHAKYPRIPLVLMTSQGNEEIAVRALAAGAASYVPKRRLAQSLSNTIRSVLELSGTERAKERLLAALEKSDSTFRLESREELISPLVKHLQETIVLMGLCAEGEEMHVGIALCEALNNALEHGNLEVSSDLKEKDFAAYARLMRQRSGEEPYRDRRIHVAANFNRDEARFVIRDEGPGFDVAGLPDPREPANLDRASGRGVFLIRAFMDEVEFNDRGNEIRMVKRRAEP